MWLSGDDGASGYSLVQLAGITSRSSCNSRPTTSLLILTLCNQRFRNIKGIRQIKCRVPLRVYNRCRSTKPCRAIVRNRTPRSRAAKPTKAISNSDPAEHSYSLTGVL